MNKIKVIGQMEGTFESTNRVYDTDGISPSINTCGGGRDNLTFYAVWSEDLEK